MAEEYTEMWKGLGLDLPRHGELLGLLGQFYQQLFVAQENRPQSMAYFDAVIYEVHGGRIKELLDHKKAGGKGVWLIDCQYNPTRLANLIRLYTQLLRGRTTVGCEGAVTFMQPRESVPTFIDPPYFPESGQNNLYGEQMSKADHQALADQMRKMRKWLMTYDFSGEVARNLYFGFDKRVVDVRYSSPSARKSGTWKQDAELVALHGFKI